MDPCSLCLMESTVRRNGTTPEILFSNYEKDKLSVNE